MKPSSVPPVHFLVALLGLCFFLPQTLPAQEDAFSDSAAGEKTTTEPEVVPDGTLMIVGGGVTENLHRHFRDLAGGTGAEIVCVPTALPHGRLSGWCRRFFREAGVPKENRTVLHTRKRSKANTESFVEPLRAADAVWFTGGRQWRLVKAYGGTRTLEAFHRVLERGGVIGGTSAGASIQGSFLVRGDPTSKRIVVGEYMDGFGFLPQSAIDQHLRARGRTYDLIEVIEARPDLLGLGVDEGTAAVVRGDTLRVVGEGGGGRLRRPAVEAGRVVPFERGKDSVSPVRAPVRSSTAIGPLSTSLKWNSPVGRWDSALHFC